MMDFIKDKKKLALVIFLVVVLVPILWNKLAGVVIGKLAEIQQSKPKVVQVANPVKQVIEPTYETTGRISAENSIDVIARVDGWLEEQYFTEGDIVQKGQKLFKIQDEEYRLAVQDAAARVNENAAVYKNSVIEYNRAAMLIKDDMISRELYDNSIAMKNSKKATLDAARAQLEKARLNLGYTTITAPMTGRIGKLNISKGNYVKQDSGTLASIYTTNPMRVVFDVKSSEYILIKKCFHKKGLGDKIDNFDVVEVKLKLSDGSIYDQVGKISFANNKIDETTGSVKLRALFENPLELLIPGDYVNVILTLKVPHEVMTIPQSATKTEVGTGYYVWVVKDGKAVKRNVVVNYNIDNNWVVESGLSYDDQIVVKGIQDIYKSGQPITPQPYKPDNSENSDGKKGADK